MATKKIVPATLQNLHCFMEKYKKKSAEKKIDPLLLWESALGDVMKGTDASDKCCQISDHNPSFSVGSTP